MLSLAEINRRQATRKAAKEAEREKRNRLAALENDKHRKNKLLAKERDGARVILPVKDGCVFVVSDQHYMPGREPSLSHIASVKLAKKLKPYGLIGNGDAIDGACISRWPASSFTDSKGRPSVLAELAETDNRLKDYDAINSIEYRIWNMGNHDARFETRLAEKVPEYAGVNGFTLKEHFPDWLPAWRTDIWAKGAATPAVIVKHRYKGGSHAGQNNVLWSGTSFVTGHDHMLKAYPISTATGLHWGIHAGTMAPVTSPQFTHYTEDNPVNWQEGFVILHFRNGRFTGPELVHVMPDGRVLFRGEELKL